MAEHWKPEGESGRWTPIEGDSLSPQAPWPTAATVGLVVIAAACIALGAVVYQVAGPRDAFAEEDAGGN